MTTPIDRARFSLKGHALLKEYDDLRLDKRLSIAHAATTLVEDVATATQNRALLEGDPKEDRVLTEALFANAVCMLVRWERKGT